MNNEQNCGLKTLLICDTCSITIDCGVICSFAKVSQMTLNFNVKRFLRN